jgi:YbbR domain-containing protein
LSPFRWIFRNLSTLILAFALSVVVWISAVTAADPNIESNRTVPLEIEGLDPNMLVVGNVPTQVRVTLEAPTSVVESMGTLESAVNAWVDVSGLGAGTHDLEVQIQVNPTFRPTRRIQVVPEIITLTLEPLITQTFPVNLEITGEPAIGYQKRNPQHDPESVTVSGPATLVGQVVEVHAELDISGAVETIARELPLVTLNQNGQPVNDVTITPAEVNVTQPIFLQGGYRNVIVRVVTEGQPANGYKLTNITVSPLNVVVFSSDPQLVNDLPGYVETESVILTDAEDDVNMFVGLSLPEGISIVDDQFVLVQVSIAAIEGSLTMTLPVTPIGLLPIHAALIEPQTVDVILLGPVPILDTLDSSDLRVIVDLTELDLGIHLVIPIIDILPDRIDVETILPSTVEVEIIIAPTPTPTRIPGLTPVPTPEPTPEP